MMNEWRDCDEACNVVGGNWKGIPDSFRGWRRSVEGGGPPNREKTEELKHWSNCLWQTSDCATSRLGGVEGSIEERRELSRKKKKMTLFLPGGLGPGRYWVGWFTNRTQDKKKG
ncbi:hypothetical protein PIB30_006071 [Stylosanthes scabra]|uniref:Uncharacterized protein n=1 Tax=Stylosanthes scabra TaxID=79078 RepID=A0ABU6V2F8_9FABA|nr:hypothetical protein [Stylosanthes scabra]